MPTLDRLTDHLSQQRDRLLEELFSLLSQPSVSAQGWGIAECADHVAALMERSGVAAEVVPLEGGYPLVLGRVSAPGAERTLTFYAHYDVQPVEPLELWQSPPFAPTVRDGRIYARGATDDKGNLFALLKGVEALRAVGVPHAANLQFIFEGEEEIGSAHLGDALAARRSALLPTEAVIVCERGMHESGRPQMWLGHKGGVGVEITLRGPKRDVHSGHAPLIPNPAWELAHLLTQLADERGQALIPGFYDRVRKPTPAERRLLDGIPFDAVEYCQTYGLAHTLVEGSPAAMLEQLIFQPTCNINGLVSGYTGEGRKSIVPSTATVKMDLRLVNDQTAEEIGDKVRRYLDSLGYGPEQVSVDGKDPYRVSPEEPAVARAMAAVARAGEGEPVVWPAMDGGLPMHAINRALGVPCFVLGLGAPFSLASTHAPNENVGVEEIMAGIRRIATVYATYGQ